MRRRPLIIGLGLSCAARRAAADVSQLLGQNVEISPTTLTLSGPGSTTICTVYNNGGAQTSSQIRLREWYQSYGQDVLIPTEDVVASPPFMTLEPGARQIVRVANLSAQPGASELCYRLLLNELPSPGSLTDTGVTVLIAFSLPVFVTGTDAQPPQLTASFGESTDGKPVLRILNSGDVHARLADVSYARPRRLCAAARHAGHPPAGQPAAAARRPAHRPDPAANRANSNRPAMNPCHAIRCEGP
jgi:fimbrial chaperone protein